MNGVLTSRPRSRALGAWPEVPSLAVLTYASASGQREQATRRHEQGRWFGDRGDAFTGRTSVGGEDGRVDGVLTSPSPLKSPTLSHAAPSETPQ
jgi:hypothetical protein